MMMMQLSIKEIDQIISFLQEPYPYDLIKRLEELKLETELNIKLHNQLVMSKMEEERSIQEHGLGTSPVSNAYFEIKKIKVVWIVIAENDVYREILGSYSTYEKAEKACLQAQKDFKCTGATSLRFYTTQVELDRNHE